MKLNKTVDLVKPFPSLMSLLVLFYLLCNFGNKVTDQIVSLSDSYFEALWYHLPVDQQKYFILMISNAQRPIYMEGFTTQNTCEKFKSVTSMTLLCNKFKFCE